MMVERDDGMRKKVALLVGGPSREKDVSIMSGKSVHKALLELGHEVFLIDPQNDFIQVLLEIKPDVVFNCLHGSFGEDGVIQGVLEFLRIPYTHSGVAASAVAMNKVLTKKILSAAHFNTPEYLEMRAEDLFTMLACGKDPMPKPYVIKAIQQGSTIGVYMIIDDSSPKPTPQEWTFGTHLFIEKYIEGHELSVAVFADKALGVLELRPKSGFYDYVSKYSDGMTEHIYPAPIPDDICQQALQVAERIHQTLGCRTLSRSDFRYDPTHSGIGGLFFLEINTHPGFTDLSIVPEIAKYNGISFLEIVKKLLEDATCEINL